MLSGCGCVAWNLLFVHDSADEILLVDFYIFQGVLHLQRMANNAEMLQMVVECLVSSLNNDVQLMRVPVFSEDFFDVVLMPAEELDMLTGALAAD